MRIKQQDWKAAGRPGPVISFECPERIYRRLQRMKAEERRSRSAVMLCLIEEALAARDAARRRAESPPPPVLAPHAAAAETPAEA